MNSESAKVKVYAVSSALTAEACVDSNQRHTVSLEVANGRTPNFDWQNKLQVLLMPNELPVVLAVLLGWAPMVEAHHHGPRKDKGFLVQHQGGHVFLKIFQGNNGVKAIPIGGADLLALSGLLTHQLLKNSPWLTSDALLTLLKNTIGRTAGHQPSMKRTG